MNAKAICIITIAHVSVTIFCMEPQRQPLTLFEIATLSINQALSVMPEEITHHILEEKSLYRNQEEPWCIEKKFIVDDTIVGISFAQKGKLLAYACTKGHIAIIDTNTYHRRIYQHESLGISPTKTIKHIYFHPQGKKLIFTASGMNLYTIHLPTNEVIKNSVLMGMNEIQPSCLTLSNDENLHAYARGSYYIIDQQNPTPGDNPTLLAKELIHRYFNSSISAIAFSPDNKKIAVATNRGFVEIVNVDSSSQEPLYHNKNSSLIHEINHLMFNDDQTKLVCYSSNNCEVIDINTQQSTRPHIYRRCNLWGSFFNNNGDLLLYGLHGIVQKKDEAIKITNPATKEEITVFFTKHLDSPIIQKALSESYEHLALGLENGTVLLIKKFPFLTKEQKLLRLLLRLWICCKKPSKNITSPDLLCKAIISDFSTEKYCLDKKEFTRTWKTLSEDMQCNIWENMSRLIQEHGTQR